MQVNRWDCGQCAATGTYSDRENLVFDDGSQWHSNSCYFYVGTCGAFQDDKSECWDDGYCLALSSGDCCQQNEGMVPPPAPTGALNGRQVIGLIVGMCCICLVVALASCFCCPSCPWAKARARANNGDDPNYDGTYGTQVMVVAPAAPIQVPHRPAPVPALPAYSAEAPPGSTPAPIYTQGTPQAQPGPPPIPGKDER